MSEYDKDRADFNNYDRGRIFEDGTELYFAENQRNGYRRGLELPTDLGPRRYDKAKILPDGRILAVEDKSGRVISENDIREFKKDRELLDRRKVDQLLIRTVEGEKISEKAKQQIKELQDDFGERVVHQIIPRWQAREIWARGLELEKERQRQKENKPRQLELIKTYELSRAERARKRLENIRQIVQGREVKERAEREREQQREREQTRQALTIAKHRKKVNEREVREKARRARFREEGERRESRRKEIAAQRKDLARVVGEQAQAIELARAEGRRFSAGELSEAHRLAVKSLRRVRRFERSDACALIAGLESKGEVARETGEVVGGGA